MPNLSYDVVALDKASATFIKMAEQVERLTNKLDKLDGMTARVGVKADTAAADTSLDNTERKRKNLDGKKATVKVEAKVDKSFAEATVMYDRFLGAFSGFALPAGIVAASPAVLELAGAATQLVGVLGLVPAVGLAAGTALGVVKMATSGMGDAFKAVADGDAAKLSEALAKLSPNARAVVTEYQALKPALTGLQLDVQDKFWANIAGDLKDLAGAYLPTLRTGLGTTASAMNELVNNTIVFATQSEVVARVGTIFDNVGESMFSLTAIGWDAVDMLTNVGMVGSDFLPALAAGFGQAADRAAEFVDNAAKTGQLHDWIATGLSILGSLIQTVIELGKVFHNIWTAAGTDTDAFMKQLRDVVAFMAAWTGSVQGQAVIADFFQKIRDIVTALLPLLGVLGVALYSAFSNIAPLLPGIITALTAVLAAAAPLVAPFTALALSIIPALSAAVQYLAPVLGPVVAALIVANTATKVWMVTMALGSAITKGYAVAVKVAEVAQLAWMIATQSGTRALLLFAIAQKASNLAMAVNPIGLVVVAIGLLVAALVLAWNHSETFRKVVTGAWQAVKDAAAAVGAWFTGPFVGFFRDAFEWVKGLFADVADTVRGWGVNVVAILGPFIGLPILIVQNWGTITAFFAGLWGTVVSGAQAAWAAVAGAVAAGWSYAQGIFASIGTVLSEVGGYFMGLYTDYVKPAFDAIAFAGKFLFTLLATVVIAPIVILMNIMQATFDALAAVAVQAFGVISEEAQIWWSVISAVWNAVIGFLASIFVPAWNATRDAAVAAFQFISDYVASWWAIVVGVWNGVVAFLASIFVPAYTATRDAIVAAFQAVSDYVTAWWATTSAIWTIVVTFLTTTFVAAYNYLRDQAIAAWTALAEYLTAWWAGVQAVWNEIVAFVTVTLTTAYNYLRDQAIAAWTALMAYLTAWWVTISALWNGIVTYITGAFVAGYQAMAAAVTAVWAAVQAMLSAWWQWVLANVWQPIVTYIIGPFVQGFNAMRDGASAAWNGLRDAINAGWAFIRDNIWNPLITFITRTIPDGFSTGVAAVGRVWDGIKKAMRDPVQAAIDIVWNNGIVKVWNDVANAVGLSTKLAAYNLPAFAEGGPIRGGTPGKDSVPILAMPGEFMFSKKAVDAAGGTGAMHGLMSALTGMPVKGGDGASLPAGTAARMPMYADGGSVGGTTLTGSATSGTTTATGSVTASTDWLGVLSSLTNIGSSLAGRVGGTPWGELIVGFGKKVVGDAVTYLTDKVKAWMATLVSVTGGAPPAGSGAVVAQVMQAAQGFGWASGPQWAALSWIISHESGWNPTAQNPTSTAYGLFQFLNGTWGTVGGSKTSNPYQQAIYGMRYIQSRYSSPVGAQAFWQSHGWYANGGIVDSPTFGLLGEAGPEVVLPMNRPDRAANLADRAGVGGNEFHVHVTTSAAASADQIIRSAMFESRLARMSGRYGRRG